VIVVKFGGTSVGDAEAIGRAAEIVRGRIAGRPLVVVSAMAGVTNALVALAEQASKGHLAGALGAVEGLASGTSPPPARSSPTRRPEAPWQPS
jgi:aspartate kinase